jgi:hypothetical protein
LVKEVTQSTFEKWYPDPTHKMALEFWGGVGEFWTGVSMFFKSMLNDFLQNSQYSEWPTATSKNKIQIPKRKFSNFHKIGHLRHQISE